MVEGGSKAGSGRRTLRFLLVSLAFHLLFTVSIFDIYFTSPVVHPSRRYSVRDTFAEGSDSYSPPADRLVLIVGDGLRADTLFKEHDAETMMPEWGLGLDGDALQAEALQVDHHRGGQRGGKSPPSASASPSRFVAAPHLRDVVLNRGSWGISHTRVPTESRPGHVALIAGMYEDVSAVTKGWKLNPVDFDSLMNVSTHAYTFGSPDILPMFAQGAASGRVDMWMYDESAEDFTKDAAQLDLWVLHRLEELFKRADEDVELAAQLRAPGNVFFLHLLGLDTTGHTYRPHSREYVGNLVVVDAIVKRVEAMFEKFFGQENDRTAWIFSADHGMSAKGNHGDGEAANTRTPLVAWGAGLHGPRPLSWQSSKDAEELSWREAERELDAQASAPGLFDRITAKGDPMPEADAVGSSPSSLSASGYFDDWWQGLDRLARNDVEQADVTALMATLLGLPLPANSEGRLPLAYLDLNEEDAARAMLTNAREVLEIYRVKHQERAQRMIRYVPYEGLPPDRGDGDGDNDDGVAHLNEPGTHRVKAIQDLIAQGDYAAAITLAGTVIDDALAGAQYLQTYDWLLLVCIISGGYVASVLYGVVFLLKTYAGVQDDDNGEDAKTSGHSVLTLGRTVGSAILAVLYSKFYVESSPITYYLYATFTVFYWTRVVDQRGVFTRAWRKSIDSGTTARNLSLRLFALLTLTLSALELMVLGYLERWAWTLGFFALGFVWPFVTFDEVQRSKNEGLVFVWGLVCVACGLFTLGGVDKEESSVVLALSGAVFVVAGWVVVRNAEEWLSRRGGEVAPTKESGDGAASSSTPPCPFLPHTTTVLRLQIALTAISTLVTLSSSYHLRNKLGLPLLNQCVGWGVLFCTSTLPFALGFQRPKVQQQNVGAPLRQPASQRLAIIIFASAPIFILLSLRDEALFFAVYTAMLLVWSKMEGVRLEEEMLRGRREAVAAKKEATAIAATTGTATTATTATNTSGALQPSSSPSSSSTTTATPPPRTLGLSECRIALTFLFFLHVGFFGTGNIASISSFYLSPVYRLIPVFSPFAMAALLILKILIPFLVLISIFHSLCIGEPSGRALGRYLPGDEPSRRGTGKVASQRRPSRAALEAGGPPILGPDSIGGLGLASAHGPIVAASIATDILALNFLFAVKTSGAWLEIGRTITHFAMANLLEVFMFALSVAVAALY